MGRWGLGVAILTPGNACGGDLSDPAPDWLASPGQPEIVHTEVKILVAFNYGCVKVWP